MAGNWCSRSTLTAVQVPLLLLVLLTPGARSQEAFTTSATDISVSVEWGAGKLPAATHNFTIYINDVSKRTVVGGEVQAGGFYTETGLRSGVQHLVRVETFAPGGPSAVRLNETVVTKPKTPQLVPISPTDVTPSSLTVRWSHPLDSSQAQYKVHYRDRASKSVLPVVKTVLAPATSYQIVDLLPGHLYNINVTAINFGVSSLPATVNDNTAPSQPNITNLYALNTHALEVTWVTVDGSNQSSFDVTYEMYGKNQPISVPDCGRGSCVINMDPATTNAGQQFAVKVFAVQGTRRSVPAYMVGTTKPQPAVNLTLESRQTTSLTIGWREPRATSFTTFRIEVEPDEGPKADPAKNGQLWIYTRNGLHSGQLYHFYVYTVSGGSQSDSAYIHQYTRPPMPSPPVRGPDSVPRGLHLVWNTPVAVGNFDKYRLTISRAKTPTVTEGRPIEVAAGATNRAARLTRLTPGAQYVITMVTVVGDNVTSDTVSATFRIKPLPPQDIAVVLRTEDQLKVRWSPPPPAPSNEFTGFTVEVRDLQSSRKELSYPSTLEASFSNLNPGTLYTIDVRTVSGDQASDAKSKAFYTMPNPPSNLHQVAVTNSSITVEWNPPVPSGTRGYDAFRLYIRVSDQQSTHEVELAEKSRSNTFTDLEPGTQYEIRLVSSISGTESKEQVINVLTKPFSPKNLQVVTKSTESLKVRWEAPSSGVVDSYQIALDTQSVAASGLPRRQLPSTQRQYTQAGMTPGVTYTVSVYVQRSRASPPRTEQSYPATLAVTMNPLAPANLEVTYTGTTSVEVRWDEPAFSSAFDAYEVAVMQGSVLVATERVPSETRTKNLGDLAPGQQYTVSLYTMSNNERSAAISRDFATSPVGVATIDQVEVLTDSIEIAWSRPSGTGFNRFELAIAPNDGSEQLPVAVSKNADLKYTFRNLKPGVLYNISIQVVANLDSISQPFSRTISTKPSAVIDLTTQALSTSAIRVGWIVDGTSRQSAFIVRYRNVASASETVSREVTFVAGLETYNTQLTDLGAGSAYTIAVLAISNGVQSPPAQRTQTTKPRTVQDVTVTVQDATKLRITWDTAADSRQEAFVVRYRGMNTASAARWRTERTAIRAIQLTRLFPGERYEVQVSALSGDQTSATTTTYSNTNPLPPENLAVDRAHTTTSSVRLIWVYDSSKTFLKQLLLRYAIQRLSSWEEEYISTLTDSSRVLTGLEAGRTYVIQLFGVTDFDIASLSPAQVNATVKPELTTVVTLNGAASSNDTLTVEYSANTGQFDQYVFTISAPPGRPPVVKERTDGAREVRFTGLEAGNEYTVGVRAVSGDVSSVQRDYHYFTRPNQPEVVPNQSQRSVRLTIVKPRGLVDRYHVACEPQGPYPCVPANRQVDADRPSVDVTYTDLKPYSNYRFTVTAVRGPTESRPRFVSARTEEAAPGQVMNLTHMTSTLKPQQVTLMWLEPLERNGDLKGYRILYNGTKQGRSHDTPAEPISLDSNARNYTFHNLKAGYTYIFTVQAITVDVGDRTVHEVKMPVGPPHVELPDTKSKPRRVNSTTTYSRFSVELIDPFSDRNGEVVDYVLLVTTDRRDPLLTADGDVTFKTWKEVVGRDLPGTYQAIPRCGDLFSSNSRCGNGVQWFAVSRRSLSNRISFMVGNETHCQDRAATGYCNGPVLPSTTYYVKLRGYTESGQWADSAFSDGITTEKAQTTGNTVLITVIVVLLLLLLVVFIIVAVILYRRGVRCTKSGDDVDKGGRPGALGLGQLRFSSRRKKHGSETTRPVKVADFAEHVRVMSADSDFKFSEEYEDLKPVGREQLTNAAELPVNRNKNRFTNILPYDHSRVKLLPTDDEEGSDYINANYMPGYNSKREFVGTQGPLPSTRDDFWRMVWEQNCLAIVMLTKCVEKGREKCDHYWPVDSEPMFYGDLQVVVLNETRCPEWIVTEFRISKGEQYRNLKHFHYIAWPDFGVPERPQSLIRFVRLVRSKVAPDGGPIVTHCSAGVGRSGAFIAVDWLLLMLKENSSDSIDIFNLVYQLRQNRPQMVQTEQQYICIHHCLLCVVEGRENDPSPYSGEENEAYDDDEGITVDRN